MVLTFVAGAAAGVGLYKLYDYSTCTADNTIDGRSSRALSSSRATELNRRLGYNEGADSTSSHVNFLSDMVNRLWPYMSKALEASIKESVEPGFKESLPGPLSSLKFTKLDLGDVPIVIDNILVREMRRIDDAAHAYGKDSSYLQFEWDITWQSDCDIQLATDKVAGLAAISFGVKTITLSGRMQVIAKPLGKNLPCIDAVQCAFVNPPKIELDFTGLANVADMKLQFGGVNVVDVNGVVRGIVDDILASTMVLPTRLVVPLVDNVDFRDIYAPQFKGMARVRLHSGRGFQIQKASTPFGREDIPDVYVKIRLGVEKRFKSSVIKDNCNPVWDPDEEFHDFMVCHYRDQILEIQVWDEDTGTLDTDDHLGYAYVTLGQVLLEADRNGLYEVELLSKEGKGRNGVPTGSFVSISMEKISFTTKDLTSMTDLAMSQYASKSANLNTQSKSNKVRKKEEKKQNSRIVGLTTILVSHANNLPFAKPTEANTLVKVYTGTGPNKKEVGVTPPIPDSLNPQYMTPITFPVTVAMQREWNSNIAMQCYTFEMFQQDLKYIKLKSLGEIVVDGSEINTGEEMALRETRSVGKYPKTQLAFAIAFAGVAAAPQKNIHYNTSGSSSIRSIVIGGVESSESGIELTDSNQHENRLRITIVKGYGFQLERKTRLSGLRAKLKSPIKGGSGKYDIPDVYCMIKFGSSPNVWRTPTIKDSETPEWDDECRDYKMESLNEVISIDVWDENRRSDDTYYGSARTSVGKVLLNNGVLDVLVKEDISGGKQKDRKKKMGLGESNMYITIQCEKL